VRHAISYPPVRDRAVRVALVVGAVLFATPVVAAKILLTFAVPYTVSTYSALQVNRLR